MSGPMSQRGPYGRARAGFPAGEAGYVGHMRFLMLRQPLQAAVTNSHRLGGLNNRPILTPILEAGSQGRGADRSILVTTSKLTSPVFQCLRLFQQCNLKEVPTTVPNKNSVDLKSQYIV